MFSALIAYLFPHFARIERKLDLLLQETAWLNENVRELVGPELDALRLKLKASADALRASVDANKPK